MARATEIELTSRSDGGAWNWRAVGARQPRGTLSGDLVPSGAAIGDVFRAELEFAVEGMEVVAVSAVKNERRDESRHQKIELISSPLRGPDVSVTYASGGARGGREGREGRDGRDSDRRRSRDDGPARRDGARRGPARDGAARSGGARRPARAESERPSEGPAGADGASDRRPGPPRRTERSGARPERSARRPEGGGREGGGREGGGRDGSERGPRPGAGPVRARRPTVAATHRNAMLAELRPEQLAVAEQLLLGGMPAVRQAITEQNAAAGSDASPAIAAEPVMALAEELLPLVNLASWKDRAAAAQLAGKEFRLRELRAVVAAARTLSLDDEGRTLSKALQESLNQRQGALRDEWAGRMTSAIEGGRVLDALRLSARPPEPALRLSAELAVSLAAAAGAAMTADLAPDAWLALLGAVLESPVRRTVKPVGLPDSAETKESARRAAGAVPELAKLVGLRIPPPPPRRTSVRQPVSAASGGGPAAES
jgi:hypothetical protein